MSSFRIILTLAVMAALAGCGFRPLYGDSENAAINSQLGAIQIATIEDRVGQKIHNLLLDRLNPRGRPQSPLYTLSLTAQISKAEIGLKFTEVATRANLKLTANYFLTDNQSGAIFTEGTVRSVNSYNIPDSEVAHVAAENDAIDRAAREISDEVKTRLSLLFSKQSQ